MLIALTVAVWLTIRTSIKETASQKFNLRAKETKYTIQKRMQAYKQVLLGGTGLFAASDSVTRSDWAIYFDRIKIEQNYPGILGIGYAIVLPPDEVENHIQRIRAEGFPDYTVWPQNNDSKTITSIVYLEPFTGRNLRAFGYDMFSDKTRRKAMMEACDSGEASVSSKVTLVQETSVNVQPGFLMYLPLYQKNQLVETVEQRRKAIKSFVYSPFRMNDLMEGIFDVDLPNIHLTIFDEKDTPESLMYNSDSSFNADDLQTTAEFALSSTVDIEGHTWFLKFASLPAYENSIDYERPKVIIIAGFIIGVLVFFSIRFMAETWRVDRKLEQILESTGEGIYGIDLRGCCTFINRSASQMLGYKQDEYLNKDMHRLIHSTKEDGTFYPAELSPILQSTKDGKGRRVDNEVFRRSDGSLFPIEYFSSPLIYYGEIMGAVVTFNDITSRLKSEAEVKELATRLKDTVESVTDAFFTLDRNWKFTYVNEETEKLLLKKRGDLLNAGIWEKFPEMLDTIIYKEFNNAFHKNIAESFEEYYKPLDKWLEVHLYPSNYGLTVFLRDISERVEAAEKIEASLKEKDVLLKEIHHRVKNNLQIIASLLNLQHQYAGDKQSAGILIDSQNRIKSMALIHEKLYQADNVSRINFSSYARDLTRHLFASYFSGTEEIKLNIEIEDVNIQLDKTISLGLIINELVSNSLKHGFGAQQEDALKGQAEVFLGMKQNEKGEIVLTICDNGKGFPDDIDFSKTNSLGLQLVNALVEQIDGIIELKRNNGSKFIITFTA